MTMSFAAVIHMRDNEMLNHFYSDTTNMEEVL